MNQTSLVGRPLYQMAQSIARYVEKRSSWSGPLTSSSPELARLWGTTTTNTGVSVSEESSLTYSTVWACVNNISTDVASLPLVLYKRLKDGGKERLTDHKLYRILHDEPNPEMSSMTFRGMVQAHALTWGNGYAEIVRDGAGRVSELWPITPHRVTVRRDARGVYYEVSRDDGPADRVAAADMLHLQGLGYNGLTGYNLVEKARESIALGLATEKFGGTFFGNGATFGGGFKHPGRMSEQAIKNFRESVNAQHQGPDKAHKFIVVEEGMEYQKYGVDPDHAQFLETRIHQVEEICRYFRMPPHKVQHLLRSTNNNIEHQGIEYYSDTLRPWCVRWEQEIKRKLIAPSERLIQLAEHKIEGVLRGDLPSRYAAYAVGRQWGWLSANDICEFENLNPLPGEQGKIYLVPMNMAPGNRLNDIVDKQVEPTPAPVAPVAPKNDDDAKQNDRMVQAIRTALGDVEARMAEHVTKAAAAEAQLDGLRTGNGNLEALVVEHRSEAEKARIEAAKLQAVLLLANERTEKLETEKETARVAAAEHATALARELGTAQAERDAAITAAEADRARLQGELDAAVSRAAETDAAKVDAERRAADLDAGVKAAEAVLAETRDIAESDRAKAEQELTQLREALDLVNGTVTTREQEHAEALQQIEALQQRVAEAEAERVRVAQDAEAERVTAKRLADELQEASVRAGAAAGERDAHRQAVTEAQAVIAKLTQDVADTEATRQALAEAEAKLAAATAEADRVSAEALAKVATEQSARVSIEADLERARVDAARISAEAETARALAAQAESTSLALTESRSAADQKAQEALARWEAERTARADVEAQLQEQRKAHAAHLQTILPAQRDLAIDIMGRLVRVESDRARRNQGSPSKLKAWAEAFYMQQEDRYLDALRPFMRAHLVFIGSTEDADAYTRRLIAPQLTEAVQQIRTVADGDPEDFSASLERLLTKWEHDRPAAIADRVFHEEMTYVRSL